MRTGLTPNGSGRRIVGDFGGPQGYRSTDQAGRISGPLERQPFQQPAPRSGLEQPHSEDQPLRRGTTSGRRHSPKRQSRRTPLRKLALRSGLVVFVLTFAVAGFLATKGYLKLNGILKGGGAAAALETNVDPSKLRGEGDGRVNILLLGRGGEGHDGPDLTDTILVASIDPVNKKAALVSVPRDTYVEGKNGDSKINAVFANTKNAALHKGANTEAAEKAGISAIEDSVEDVLGIQMHYYVIVDFKGFEQAVTTVGGVTINVPEELRDPTMAWENHHNPVLAKKGIQDMDAKQALLYVRSRHGSARGDFDRAERQRLFIMALKDKI
jgi:LCP family protein required for cell wall assembly